MFFFQKDAVGNDIVQNDVNRDTPNLSIASLHSVSHDQQTATWIQTNTNTKSECHNGDHNIRMFSSRC